MAIADCRMTIHGLVIVEWGFGLSIADWIADWIADLIADCRLVLKIGECAILSKRAEFETCARGPMTTR